MMLLRFRLLAVFSLAYLVSYLFRGVNLGFAPFLTHELGLSTVDLGTLTSLYFLGLAGAQIPAGVMLDHFGPRRVTALLMLVAAAGAMLSGLTHSFGVMLAGRLLIGVGVSACLGGAFKATSQHFPTGQLTFVNGIVMAAGGVGGIVVGSPLTWLLSVVDWRTITVGLAATTAVTAAAVWLFAPPAYDKAQGATFAEQFAGTWQVLRSHAFWKLAAFSGLTQGVFYAMQSLWVGAFLRDVVFARASTQVAASRSAAIISVLGMAFIVGNIAFGAWARLVQKRGVSVYVFSGIAMVLFVLTQLAIALRAPLPEPVLWAAYGAFGGTGVLTYSVLANHFPARLIGRVNATFTLVIFLTIFVLQAAIGAVLARVPTSVGHHLAVDHQYVWIVLAVLQSCTGIWYFLPAKKRRPQPASTVAISSDYN
ncbi:MFS transporter [Paraburkholderia sp. RL17-347-BIC-D]|uniref:MFS transporter n=1 Tax=Paraburkholderia sp. RL17-347-BIC-D TaxID=3031632 RepID=UPI0038BAE66B